MDVNYTPTVGDLSEKTVESLVGLHFENIIKPVKEKTVSSNVSCSPSGTTGETTHEMLNKRFSFDLEGLIISNMLSPKRNFSLVAKDLTKDKAVTTVKDKLPIQFNSTDSKKV